MIIIKGITPTRDKRAETKVYYDYSEYIKEEMSIILAEEKKQSEIDKLEELAEAQCSLELLMLNL